MALAHHAIWEHYWHYLRADAHRAPSTIDEYRYVIWAWFAFLQAKPWHRATKADLPRFLDRPALSGPAAGQYLSPNTRLHYAATICAFYAWAHAAGHLRRDPMAGYKLPKGGQPRPRSFSPNQLHAIIGTAQLLDDRLHVMVALAYGAGLRCAEIAGLRIEDVHLGHRRGWILVHGKGGKDRAVDLYPEVRAAIVRELATRGSPRVGPLIANRIYAGAPVTPGTVSRVLSTHIRGIADPDRAGELDERGCPVTIAGSGHGLRHTFAVNLMEEAGEDKLVTISRLLGHAKTSTTEQVYLLGYKGDSAAVVDKLPYPSKRTRRT